MRRQISALYGALDFLHNSNVMVSHITPTPDYKDQYVDVISFLFNDQVFEDDSALLEKLQKAKD